MTDEILELPLGSPVYRNVDGAELTDLNYRLVNAYLDELKASVSFPGFSKAIDLALDNIPVRGAYWWDTKEQLLLVCAGSIYVCTYSTSTSSWTLFTTQVDYMEGANPVSFCRATTEGLIVDTEHILMANGGKIAVYDGEVSGFSQVTESHLSYVTSLSFVKGYVLATVNDNDENESNRFYYSSPFFREDDTDLTASVNWDSTDYYSASQDSDVLLATHTNKSDIYLVGKKTVEIWEVDGSPFSLKPGAVIQKGCASRSSIVARDEGFYFLSDEKQIVMFNGSDVQQISTPYDKEIKELTNVEDCVGTEYFADGKTFIVWSFPGERTFVFRLPANSSDQGSWSEMGIYNSGEAKYTDLPIAQYLFIDKYSFALAASGRTGEVYKISRDETNYADDDIRVQRLTGHIDHKMPLGKLGKFLYIKLKRGQGNDAKLLIRWKSDNARWSGWKEFDLGASGETEIIRRMFTGGRFRSRQYEVVTTSDVGIIFLEAKLNVGALLK